MPAASDAAGLRKTIGAPSSRISPASGCSTPASTRIKVLLPAPFSPISATASPRCTTKSTAESACTPGKPLSTPRASSNGAGIGSLLPGLLLEILPELRDVGLADLARRDVDHAVLRQQRFSLLLVGLAQQLAEQLQRATPVFERVLHDGDVGVAVEADL